MGHREKFGVLAIDSDSAAIGIGRVSATGRVAYVHELNSDRSLSASSRAAPGYHWSVDGLSAPGKGAQMDIGIIWSASESVDVRLDGTHRRFSGGDLSGGRLSVSIKF